MGIVLKVKMKNCFYLFHIYFRRGFVQHIVDCREYYELKKIKLKLEGIYYYWLNLLENVETKSVEELSENSFAQ